jgi:hypothetical protein
MKFIDRLEPSPRYPQHNRYRKDRKANTRTWLMRNILPAKRAKFSCKSSILPIEPGWRPA